MPGDNDDKREELYEFIRNTIESAIENGKFPSRLGFSITITDGNLPLNTGNPKRAGSGETGKGINQDENTSINNNPLPGPVSEPVKGFHTEIHKNGDGIIVYADIPGADNSNTAVSVDGENMMITSLPENIKYQTVIKIPPLRKETLKFRSKNGVLELSALTV